MPYAALGIGSWMAQSTTTLYAVVGYLLLVYVAWILLIYQVAIVALALYAKKQEQEADK